MLKIEPRAALGEVVMLLICYAAVWFDTLMQYLKVCSDQIEQQL